MALIVGMVLALAVGAFATGLRMDRDRAFYPTVTIVVASYYVLFAAMGGATDVLIVEVVAAGAFVGAAAWGFRSSQWIVVAALAAHGILDLFHGSMVPNPGVPAWWPQFCSAYDVTAALYLAGLLARRGRGPRPSGISGLPDPGSP